MVQTVSEKIARPHTYQQALDDFGITELLSCIRNYTDEDFNAALMNLEEQELESLAAIFIQRLTSILNGKLIASYLNAIRHGDSQVIFDPTNLEIPLPSIDLPDNFLNGVNPRYQEGDRVRWRPLTHTTDWGIVIGRFYTLHHCQWAVGYLIRLDQDSPSSAWTVADTAWEKDLEPNTDKDWERSGHDRTNPQALHPISLLPSVSTTSPWPTPSPTPELTEKAAPTEMDTKSGYAPPTSRNIFLRTHKSLRTSPGNYNSGRENRTHPRILTQRERNLIELYSHCQLGLTPMKFYSKWSVRYEDLASICSRSISTVGRWFSRGCNYQRPASNDLRHLAIMDFLLEHFEEIPTKLLNVLCPQNRDR